MPGVWLWAPVRRPDVAPPTKAGHVSGGKAYMRTVTFLDGQDRIAVEVETLPSDGRVVPLPGLYLIDQTREVGADRRGGPVYTTTRMCVVWFNGKRGPSADAVVYHGNGPLGSADDRWEHHLPSWSDRWSRITGPVAAHVSEAVALGIIEANRVEKEQRHARARAEMGQ